SLEQFTQLKTLFELLQGLIRIDLVVTGDNSLEEPYRNIYPRVTTQSNTFRVHMKVQTVQKVRSSKPDQFITGKDQITAEYRGSAVIERYIDPLEEDIPDYVGDLKHSEPRMDFFFRYRITNVKQFAP
ncbi:MAG: hypothetical protein AAF514_17570, partial [Verrucomicrobiota bacterium]